jgi:hypothetical protein
VILVRYGKLLAALGAARCQHAAAVLGSHSLTEAVLVDATAIVRLKCSFHRVVLFILCYYSHFWAAKLAIIFEITKNYAIFTRTFYVFFGILRNFAAEYQLFRSQPIKKTIIHL